MKRIIEFYGVPGSGKSTIIKEIKEYLEKKNITVTAILSNNAPIETTVFENDDFEYWMEKNEIKSYDDENGISYQNKKKLLLMGTKLMPKKIKNELSKSIYGYNSFLLNCFIYSNTDFFNFITHQIKKASLKKDLAGIRHLKYFEEKCIRYQRAISHPNPGLILIDEGFCRTPSQIFNPLHGLEPHNGYAKSIKEMSKKIEKMMDASFMITSDPYTCYERQKKRKFIIRGIGKERKKEEILSAIRLWESTAEMVHKNLLNKSIQIDNNGNIKHTKKEIIKKIDGMNLRGDES